MTEVSPERVSTALIEQLVRGEHGEPHAILGPHPDGDSVSIRVYKPLAHSVSAVLSDGTRVPLSHVHEGVWEGAGRRWFDGRRAPPQPTADRAERPPRPT